MWWPHEFMRWGGAVALLVMLMPGSAIACAYNKGTYELVEDKTFIFTMLPPREDSAVELARAKITHGGEPVLQGYVTASQGFSTVYFVPDAPSFEESNVALSFLNGDLRASSEEVDYMMIQGLPSLLYYNEQELWTKHSLNGEIWRRASCP